MTIKRLITAFIAAAALMGAQASTAAASYDWAGWSDDYYTYESGTWSYDVADFTP